jgi:hypothetical protein
MERKKDMPKMMIAIIRVMISPVEFYDINFKPSYRSDGSKPWEGLFHK